MSVRRTACPSCGGPVEFRVKDSLVTVCPFCRSVVARGDRTVEDWGKVADLAFTASPLRLGLRGKYGSRPFELVGRVQYRHPAGGVWDEWYAAFPGNRWGWLAEAQGRFYLTFPKPVSAKTPLPAPDALAPGRTVPFGEVGDLTVAEVGEAEVASAEGELPFRLRPGEPHRYADLEGPNGTFATFDYGDPRRCFVGNETTLDALGIPKDAPPGQEADVTVPAARLACPQCGGPLELRAPDKAERVACPNCAALLDVNQGNLKYLETLRTKRVVPVIPIGAVGALGGVEYTVLGMLERYVSYEGRKYPWTEYLLYQPRVGFRWLVDSDDHWSFVEPVSGGDVVEGTRAVRFRGERYALFQDATATVRYVVGEFYWKVEAGEQVRVRDYVCPPRMISIESSAPGKAAEVSRSLGTYLPHEEVERAFGVRGLRRGWGVAPNQPNPVDGRLFLHWAAFVAALVLIDAGVSLFRSGVDQWLLAWAFGLVSAVPAGAAFYRHAFERSRWKDSEFNPYDTGDE